MRFSGSISSIFEIIKLMVLSLLADLFISKPALYYNFKSSTFLTSYGHFPKYNS